MDFPKIKQQKGFVAPRKEDIRIITREKAESNLNAAIDRVRSNSSRNRFSGNVIHVDSLDQIAAELGPMVNEPTTDGFNLTLKDPEEMRREFEDAKQY